MSNILTCKHCNKPFDIKQMGRHLLKIHKQSYKDYVKNNLEEFKPLGWKLCVGCGDCFKGYSQKCGKCFTKNHNIKKDQNIICKFCNLPFHSKIISQHLKQIHNIEFLDYVKENLSDFEKFGWCRCIICGTISVSRSKSHNQSACSTKCLSELRKSWVGENSVRFGAILSNETKQKISKANTGKEGLKGELNPACRKDVREKISKANKEYYSIPENNPMFGKTHTPEAIKKIFAYRHMNKLEEKVANELKRNGIDYIFQFPIEDEKVCKFYDFKIKDRPIIIEVDGDFWHGNPETNHHYYKMEKIKENDLLKEEMAKKRGYSIVRLWERDINKDISVVMKSLV